MLNDALINASQELLSKQFPKIVGFEDTNLGYNCGFTMQESLLGVQILHIGMLKFCGLSSFCLKFNVHKFMFKCNIESCSHDMLVHAYRYLRSLGLYSVRKLFEESLFNG